MQRDIKPINEHIHELRYRLLWTLSYFIIALIFSFQFAGSITKWIINYQFAEDHVVPLSPVHGFKVYVIICFLTAMIFILPVILFNVWRFVQPGLLKHEKKATFAYIPSAMVLFLSGLSFGFFVIFPPIYSFMKAINVQLGFTSNFFSMYELFTFMINIVIPLALFFELPIIILFLIRIRLITPDWLRKMRRYAYFLMIIISTLISPADILSNILIALPLISLYEVSVLLSTWLCKRIEKEYSDSSSS